MSEGFKSRGAKIAAEHGTLIALVTLCIFFSIVTLSRQEGTGTGAAASLGDSLTKSFPAGSRVIIIASSGTDDLAFVELLEKRLAKAGLEVVDTQTSSPPEARAALEREARSGKKLDAIVCTGATRTDYAFLANLPEAIPTLASTTIHSPSTGYWPNFLKAGNIVNLLNQTTIYAIIAIGMTLVIITGGIDLSVGSLVAFSAVLCAALIRDLGGGKEAGALALVGCSTLAILACGAGGLFAGSMVTFFKIPPFIVTLGMMLIAEGAAFILANGSTISEIPDGFRRFASGTEIRGVPNVIVLAALLYVFAHIVMTRTVLGRYIYAVGGNAEAARLSGVPVKRVLLVVYAVCGLLAGLVGVVHTSQFVAASATLGKGYELQVIAAVVVGGTSLFGGEGKIMGTFIGALLLAVIGNGMNLVGLGEWHQKVVLGGVIIGAAVIDRKRHQS